jgi:DNA-binding response OmpR family regulator
MGDLLPAWSVPSPRPTTTRILVVKYQSELRQALQFSLRSGLYDVQTARTGREGFSLEGTVIRAEPSLVVIGRWRVDLPAHRVTLADAAASTGSDETLRLTPTEWAILELLVQHPGQLGFQRQTNYLRFHMVQLRRSSKRTRPIPATCSPSAAWATATSPLRADICAHARHDISCRWLDW